MQLGAVFECYHTLTSDSSSILFRSNAADLPQLEQLQNSAVQSVLVPKGRLCIHLTRVIEGCHGGGGANKCQAK